MASITNAVCLVSLLFPPPIGAVATLLKESRDNRLSHATTHLGRVLLGMGRLPYIVINV